MWTGPGVSALEVVAEIRGWHLDLEVEPARTRHLEAGAGRQLLPLGAGELHAEFPVDNGHALRSICAEVVLPDVHDADRGAARGTLVRDALHGVVEVCVVLETHWAIMSEDKHVSDLRGDPVRAAQRAAVVGARCRGPWAAPIVPRGRVLWRLVVWDATTSGGIRRLPVRMLAGLPESCSARVMAASGMDAMSVSAGRRPFRRNRLAFCSIKFVQVAGSTTARNWPTRGFARIPVRDRGSQVGRFGQLDRTPAASTPAGCSPTCRTANTPRAHRPFPREDS